MDISILVILLACTVSAVVISRPVVRTFRLLGVNI